MPRMCLDTDVPVFAAHLLASGRWEVLAPAVRELSEAYKNLSRAWIVARGLAGLDDVRLQDLRHSYASLAARCGISLQMIGKLLGHKVPATTARYAHARDAAAGINNQVGAAITAAIDNQAPTTSASVVKLRHRQRAAPGSPKRSGPAFSVRFLPLNR